MAHPVPAAKAPVSSSQRRRRLLRIILGGPFVLWTAAVAGCGTWKPLPPERRTRGKYGHRGD